ncbi:uncharacterized protein N7482_008782 [Penicillium canariense]|uniref:AB hydrolase-1 domain-containing protein n=1 Tax=Penicillium canariense TaxID=189055 RepID=A0A9W9HUJ9_9EURO|nr:uncharacterized protein N7482_008782 [Penicillium canariense]KAJ5157682.1 hypothetical protein N7482_008782 [Penicillium canariense]
MTMASIAFPQHAKILLLSTRRTYNYAYILAADSTKSTILFLHGFPSSCFDWRHQISFFASHGYGVLAPDLLGYGGTSKPASGEEYKAKKMAAEIAEILDHENLKQVHAVSHDTGSLLLSRLVNYFPDRLLSCTFLAVPYSKPGEHFDLDAVNAMAKQLLGKERFGYLKFFISDNAGEVLDQHSDSFFTLFYPADPSLWNDHVGPTGSMESWLLADHQEEMAPFITDQERLIHQKIMRGHHGPALNWYQALVHNLNEQDELESGLSIKIPCPVLMVFPAQMAAQLSAAGAQSNEIADDLTLKGVSTAGHWLQLEARDEVNSALKEFFQGHDYGVQF